MIRVQHWDAFTIQPGTGNPAGIVLAAQGLSDDDMQATAAAVGFNDTAFVLPSKHADFCIRYFAPRREVELCGHATIATFAALYHAGLLPQDKLRDGFTLETRAGILPIEVQVTDVAPLIIMNQGVASFVEFNGDHQALANAMGIDARDFHPRLPIIYGSTGRWTLLVPVTDLRVMQAMRPAPEQFAAVLADMSGASIHPFCLQTHDPRAQPHARHFSSPASGILEDAVTGTASGVLGAYYRRFIAQDPSYNSDKPLVMEQGYEVDRPGSVQVWTQQRGEECLVRIAGHAVFVREMQMPAA
ncbi:MAG: PhzF family phenazine biosynthesis protein [Steroidobacteraceae bacterium]